MADELPLTQRWTRAGRLVDDLDTAMEDVRVVVRMRGEANLPAGVGDPYRRLTTRAADLRVRLHAAASMSSAAQRELAKALKPGVREVEEMARRIAVFLASDSDADSLDDEMVRFEQLIESTRELAEPEFELPVGDRLRLLRYRASRRLRRDDQ
ncbi:hypothetical protein [Actinospongicola halichondriae]|uniref:hypothetical protein n=1 Tax=Actinospongicola halichondriae TaxID=3236844 RepID=UPI003D594529